MEKSKYQLKIEEEFLKTNHNIIIEACPGSGKTVTLVNILKLTKPTQKVIYLVFNKSVQLESVSKVPSYIKVLTVHAYGYSVLRTSFNYNFKLKEIKTFILGKKYLNLSHIKDEKKKSVYLFTVSKLIDLYRLNLGSTQEDMFNIALNYGVDFWGNEIQDAYRLMSEVENYNHSNHKEFMIDYVDMLYLPYSILKQECFPKYDLVTVDEVQDLSPLQFALVERSLKNNGRFILVGDKNQSIYGFLGANSDSFERMKQKPNTVTLPLSITYRCSRNIVKKVNEIFNVVEPYEKASDGIVRTGSIEEAEIGDFVLCRNNLPLIDVFLNLVKLKKPAQILGKDFGKSLLNLLSTMDFEDFERSCTEILKKKEDSLKEKGVKKPKKNLSYVSLLEKIGILFILRKYYPRKEDLIDLLDSLFSDLSDGKHITLSTIHKSKGLEANRVFLYKYDLIPSQYAKAPKEIEQERCLQYVALSRAKQELIFCNE